MMVQLAAGAPKNDDDLGFPMNILVLLADYRWKTSMRSGRLLLVEWFLKHVWMRSSLYVISYRLEVS
jgi:hypothetical protein